MDVASFLLSLPDSNTEGVQIYTEFMESTNQPDGFGEIHHTLPKSLFPQFRKKRDAPWNFKKLSPEDHVKAHVLLCAALPRNTPMAFALNQMVGRVSNDLAKATETYAVAKRLISKTLKVSKTGLKQSPETIAKRVAKTTGQKRTPAQRAYISSKLVGVKHAPLSKETREAIRLKITGKVRTPEQRKRMSDGMTGVKKTPQHIINMVAGKKAAKLKRLLDKGETNIEDEQVAETAT